MATQPAVSRRTFVGGVATAIGAIGVGSPLDLFAQGAQGTPPRPRDQRAPEDVVRFFTPRLSRSRAREEDSEERRRQEERDSGECRGGGVCTGVARVEPGLRDDDVHVRQDGDSDEPEGHWPEVCEEWSERRPGQPGPSAQRLLNERDCDGRRRHAGEHNGVHGPAELEPDGGHGEAGHAEESAAVELDFVVHDGLGLKSVHSKRPENATLEMLAECGIGIGFLVVAEGGVE